MSPDLGAPVSYLALPEGVPVLTADGHELGEVRHVLADEENDIFDGLAVRAGRRDVFVAAPQVDELYERGVVLAIDRAGAERLPEPSANPAVVTADPDDTA